MIYVHVDGETPLDVKMLQTHHVISLEATKL